MIKHLLYTGHPLSHSEKTRDVYLHHGWGWPPHGKSTIPQDFSLPGTAVDAPRHSLPCTSPPQTFPFGYYYLLVRVCCEERAKCRLKKERLKMVLCPVSTMPLGPCRWIAGDFLSWLISTSHSCDPQDTGVHVSVSPCCVAPSTIFPILPHCLKQPSECPSPYDLLGFPTLSPDSASPCIEITRLL